MREFENELNTAECGERACRHIGGIRAETGVDMILPDYMGDIKRIISIKAVAEPAGGFESDSEIEFSGTVEYKVIYLDCDGAITEASMSSDYEFSVKLPDGYCNSFDLIEVLSQSVRAAGPRKLSAKAVVGADVFMECRRSDGGAPMPMGVVLKKQSIPQMLCRRTAARAFAV